MEIENLPKDKLINILKKIYNEDCLNEEEISLILDVIKGKELYIPNSDILYIEKDEWSIISLLNVRSMICDLILKYELYHLVFDIKDNNYENKIINLSQLELIGLSSKIRDKLKGHNKRTLHKITHSGQENTKENIYKFGNNPFVGDWSEETKQFVRDTIIDILSVNTHLQILVDNIEINDIESHKNAILKSLINILTQSNYLINKQIDLSNYQMKKFKFIMDKYDSNINHFKEKGWIKDTTHDKYNNWLERFDAYNELLKNNCKNIFEIHIPPSKSDFDFINKHIKDVSNIILKYKDQYRETPFMHEISGAHLRYGMYFDKEISNDLKQLISNLLDNPSTTIEERNNLARKIFAFQKSLPS